MTVGGAVSQQASGDRDRLVGREPELAALRSFVEASGSVRALLLTGEPGIGKTALWLAGVGAARERGVRVLSARASGAEAKLSFASLIDLCDGVEEDELAGIPTPQRAALEVALLRAEPSGPAPEPHAIGLGLLNSLRALAARAPVVVAIDDVQWLDPASAEALCFAARRVDREAIGFLLTRRPGRRSALERALGRERLERREVGPLSLGAVRRVLLDRLGLSVPRRLLRRIVDTTLGNPLFALETGRLLVHGDLPAVGEEIPLPGGGDEVLGTRVASLATDVRAAALAAALSSDLRVGELTELTSVSAVDDAVEAGVLVVDGERVRVAHPLLAAAVKRRARRNERSRLHVALAGVVADEEARVLHLALAASRPDDGLAGRLASASGRASSRGAREQAVQLAAHALRLTPTAAAARAERVLALASYLYTAGELRRLTDLLIAELDALPLGAARARALLLLSEGADTRTLEDHDRYVQRALSEAGEAPGLRARALATRAANACATAIAHLDEAEAWALEAVAAAAQDPDGDERFAVYSLAWTRAMTGHPIDELCERSGSLADAPVAEWAERIAGQRLVWRGELARARPELEGLRALADSRGEVQSYTLMRLHVCELELRAGAWDTGAALLDEWGESSERELLFRPMYERCRALVAAGRGEGAEARRWATRAVARAQAAGCRWDELEAQRALAMAALLEHQPARAADHLRPVWRHTVDEGVDEPGVFPVAPELVEALAELGELDEATAVTARLRDLAERQAHPWALVSAERCAAVVRLAEAGHHEDPAAALARAADNYDELGLRFDAARSLLSLGRAQRRFRQWGSARRALDRAQSAFAAIGSHGWAEQAGSELARVGARKPRASDDLTPAQRRAAELAASGLSNKEIARTLVVTVHTVEVHLSRAYAKLGVTSRGQLARRLSA